VSRVWSALMWLALPMYALTYAFEGVPRGVRAWREDKGLLTSKPGRYRNVRRATTETLP
jgi:hypothetical protein